MIRLIWQQQRNRTSLNNSYYSFIYALIALLLLALLLTERFSLLLLLVHSYWLPQIGRNIRTGIVAPLDSVYLFGSSLLILFFPTLYALGCPETVFLTLQPVYSPLSCLLLITWSLVQCSVLYAQERFGPRPALLMRLLPSWVKQKWLIRRFNYHAAAVINLSSDCPICLLSIDETSTTTDVMTAPCKHQFHSDCLKRWMVRKMECPVCRMQLPE